MTSIPKDDEQIFLPFYPTFLGLFFVTSVYWFLVRRSNLATYFAVECFWKITASGFVPIRIAAEQKRKNYSGLSNGWFLFHQIFSLSLSLPSSQFLLYRTTTWYYDLYRYRQTQIHNCSNGSRREIWKEARANLLDCRVACIRNALLRVEEASAGSACLRLPPRVQLLRCTTPSDRKTHLLIVPTRFN